jgi:uncharacterized protein
MKAKITGKFIFIHGNQSTTWEVSFVPWLKKELEKLNLETVFVTFPDPIVARSKYWLPFLKQELKAGENDVLIGWSSGAVAAMRYAEVNKIKGSILISPSYTDLGDELEKKSGYFNKSWDWEKIKQNQEKIALIYGDNDPYIPQAEFEFISSKLKSTVIKIKNGKHFIEYREFPELLNYIKENYLS